MSSPLKRPLLAPWYRLVCDGDRLLFEHGRAVAVLEGAAVRSFVPALLPLLDGSRTLDELEGCLGRSARTAIEGTIALLAEHGLVVEGPARPDGAAMSSLALAAAHDLTPSVAAARLAGARVGVVGNSPVGAEAARLLRFAGVGEVTRVEVDEREGIEFAVVAPAPDEVSLLREWNQRALERGTCWIGLRPFDGLIWAIGPLVVPGESACYECAVLRLASHLEYAGDGFLVEEVPSRAVSGAALDLVALGILVQLSLAWVVGRDRSLPGILHVLEARPAIALGRHSVLRVPRCEACSSSELLAPRLPWHETGTGSGIAA